MSPSARAAGDLEVAAWRERTLLRLLAALSVLGFPAMVAGVWMSIFYRVYPLALIDLAVWVIIVWIWRGTPSYPTRASVILVLLYGMGCAVCLLAGPLGVGHVWLAALPSLAGVLFGGRALRWSVFTVACTLAGVGLLIEGLALRTAGVGISWWLMSATTAACVGLMVGLPAVEVVEGMRESVSAREHARAAAREAEAREAALHAEFEGLFLTTPLALLAVDEHGAVVRSNLAARKLFGALDLPTSLQRRVEPETFARLVDVAARAGREDPREPIELRGARATALTGAELDLEGAIVPITLGGRGFALLGVSNVSERLRAQASLAQALAENTVLLQEVHHRVRNNLQVVSSLLSLQADQSTDATLRAALADSMRRVRTMALIHQQLYNGEDFARIDLGAYLRTLVEEQRALFDRTEVVLALEAVRVELSQALPCGLLVSELLTNAFKHGRSADGTCRIRVSLSRRGEGFELEVADAGPGLSAPWTELRQRSLGGRIVVALARQLRGALDVSSARGARFALHCPQGAGAVAPSRPSPGSDAVPPGG